MLSVFVYGWGSKLMFSKCLIILYIHSQDNGDAKSLMSNTRIYKTTIQILYITAWRLYNRLVPVWDWFLTCLRGGREESTYFCIISARGRERKIIWVLSVLTWTYTWTGFLYYFWTWGQFHWFFNMKYW